MVRILRLTLAIVTMAAAASCSRNPRAAIIYDSSADPGMVTNGTAFDRATIDMGECRWIVVPTKTEVEFSEEPGRATLFMKKEMGFMGHPSKRMTIDEERQKMGCAYRKHEGKVFVGKFGEFDSGIEGGNSSRSRFAFPREPLSREPMTWSFRGPVVPGVLLSAFIKRARMSGASVKDSSDRWTPVVGEPDRKTFSQQGALQTLPAADKHGG